MKGLAQLIQDNDDWLIRRVLHYARERGYTRYTATLEDAWRMSIAGLSASLLDGIRRFESVPELGPDEDFQEDPLTAFGVIEAERHRERGITLALFLGLMKYYRQAYIDLIAERGAGDLAGQRLFIDRCFDRIELAFAQEWARTGEADRIAALQATNRRLTNEKNAYLTALESQSDPAIMLGDEDEIVHLNRAAARLLDRASAPGATCNAPHPGPEIDTRRASGRALSELFPWLAEAMEEFRRAAAAGHGVPCQAEIHGECRSFEVAYADMLDVTRRLAAGVLTLRDVTAHERARAALEKAHADLERQVQERTAALEHAADELRREADERRQVAHALQESEEKFRTICAAAQDAVLMMDEQARLSYWNPAAEQIFGYSGPEALGQELHLLLAPERFHDAYRAGLARFRQTGEGPAVGQTLELAAVRKDGSEFPIELSVSAVQLQGKWHAIGILRDITARKEADEALRQSEERLRLTLDNLPLIAYEFDAEGRWVLSRGKGLEDLGRAPDELVGKSVFECYQDNPVITGAVRRALEGHPQQTEAEVNGRVWAAYYSPVVGAAGKVERVYGTAIDITARKRAEEQADRRAAVLDGINRVLSEALTCESDEEVARTCLSVAEELTGSKFGLIGEVNAAGRFDTLAISNPGWEACNMPASEATELIAGMEIRGVDRSTIKEGKSRIVNDPASHPDALGLPAGHPPVTAFLGVPLQEAGQTTGMIGLANKEGGYRAADQEAVESLAVTFGEALRNKRAEQALRQREEQYRVLFENSPVGIGIADWQGNLIAYNEAMRRPGGYSPDDMAQIGNVAGLYVDPEQRTTAMARAESQGFLDQYEVQFKRKDGTAYDALLSLRPVEMLDVACWQATVQDITQEVRTRGERDRLFEMQTTLVLIARADGTIVRTSAGWGTLLGYASADMVGRSFLDFIHPDDLPASRAGTEDVARGGDVHHFENRYRHRDGTYRTLLWAASADPETGLHYGVAQDITARRHAERHQRALQQAREAVRQMDRPDDIGPVLTGVRDTLKRLEVPFCWCGINVIDDSSDPPRVQFHNMARDEEWPTAEDQTASRLVEEFWRAGAPVYRRNLAAEDTYGDREHIGEQVGSVLDVPFSHGTLAVSSPEPEAFSEQDIASVSGLAEVLSEAFQRLDDLQALQRSEDQLRQSQKMEAIGQLAGGVAHDFNNLITIINGYCQLLGKGLEPGDAGRGYLEQIENASDRAASLVRQLLAFSRRQVLQPEVLDLNRIVADIGKMLGRLLGEDVELATELDPGLGQVQADPGQLEQVLMNLVANARDAMPHGGRLTIETTNVELDETYARQHAAAQPGAYVMLAVSDSGMGMDADTQAHVFEPFFTTKPAGEGTGLGLATVYGIVKQSAGYIWVYSEPGQGTTFRIYLPRLDRTGAPVVHEQADEQLPRGSETLLVVEDEDALRELARLTLADCGYRVLAAGSGPEALEVLAEHPGAVDLLLTDVVMPGMSGPELAEHLVSQYPQMKVLYTSGYTDHAAVRNGVLGPGAAFLSKPFSPDELAHQVREVLDAPPARREPPPGVSPEPGLEE